MNFLVPPGEILPAEGAIQTPPVKGKTVKVSDPLNRHMQDFMARHPVEFTKGTLALWRALIQEEAVMRQQAATASKAQGVPVSPKSGPIYVAMAEQLQLMKDEQSGAIFDQ
ncbi:hypothetical protein ACWGQT_00055 [Streptomyces yangpuensis]